MTTLTEAEAKRSAKIHNTLWDETLELLEEQINASSPRLRFLYAPGLLFSAILWLQSQMVRLIEMERSDDFFNIVWPGDVLWFHVFPHTVKNHREPFSTVSNQFRDTFCLTQDEKQALWCLQCLRNMLAHGILSVHQGTNDGDGPALAYSPLSAKKDKSPCHNCTRYSRDIDKGVYVDFNPEMTETYFKDLRTVGKAVKRFASCLDLRQGDLL